MILRKYVLEIYYTVNPIRVNHPGQTALTRIPWLANVVESDLTMPRTAIVC